MNTYIVTIDYTYNNNTYADIYVGVVHAETYAEAGAIVRGKIQQELSDSVSNVWVVLREVSEEKGVSFRRYGDGNYGEC